MLAKIVKNNGSAVNFTPFAVPEIGEAKASTANNSAFIFPNVSEISPIENLAAETFAEENIEIPSVEEILQSAQADAANIINQAENNAAMIEAAARERGLQTANQEIAAETNAQVEPLRAEMTQTIDRIANLQSEISARVEVDLVEFALEIAKKIVGREVTIDREIAVALVKVSLKKLHDRAIAEVHLNPDDYEYVQANRQKLEFKGALDLIADASISIGGCLIHTETGDIDARIESQFEEISHGLLK